MRTSGLVSFGSHTLTHPILSRISSEQARREISGSKKILEEKLGTAVTLFAYPNGKENDFTPDTIDLLKEAGYEAAVTTIGESNNRYSDCFRLGRHGLMDDPLYISALICAGFFEFLKPARNVTKHGVWERLQEKNVTVWMRGYLADAVTGPLIRRKSIFADSPDAFDVVNDEFFKCGFQIGGFARLLWLAPDHMHVYVESDGEKSVEAIVRYLKRISSKAVREVSTKPTKLLSGALQIWDKAYFSETLG